MLKLRRVEIQGFKSFYDRTEMKFSGNGIAAVVGPNGCGKSNLSDAMSWVLGEQSAKSLRGARMEDVIFAGTGIKKALSMASVTMTLVPDEALLNAPNAVPVQPAASAELSAEADPDRPDRALDYAPPHANGNGLSAHSSLPKLELQKAAERSGEITITRRLYRSGESEYLINGKAVRLRDIQELFLGTGLGPESYAIIEQGRIGQILSNRPQDRRNVIEEAAGITKFKTRKRLAEAKLESAKQNLARVFDILEEVTRQVNSLKRQAAKTKRFGELRTESAGYLRQLLAAKFHILERETAKTAIEFNLRSTELQQLQTSVKDREEAHGGLQTGLYATEQELTAARKQLAHLHLEAERARGRLEHQVKQVQQIDQRLASGEQESVDLDRQRTELSDELTQQAHALELLGQQCGEARERLEQKAAERQRAQARLTEQERALESARQLVLRLLGESSALKNKMTQVEAQLSSADRDSARAKAEEGLMLSEGERVGRVRTQLSEKLSERQGVLMTVTERRRTIEQSLGEKRSKLGESRQTVDRLRSEFSRVKARRDSLEEVIQHRSYTTETVKRLFKAIEGGKGQGVKPAGVLADFLEVDSQYEKATEEFLHEELEYVVVRDWAGADAGIELLRNELNGRATFLVEGGGEQPSEADSPLPVPQTEAGVLTRLSENLRLTNGLAHVPLHLLPRLGNCFVAADRQVAQRFAALFPHCWFLVPDGVSYHGLSVSGGKKTGAGPLALKRELREVLQMEETRQAELNTAQSLLRQLEQDIAELTEQLEALRSQQQTHEKEVLALDHESRKLAEEFGRVQSRLGNARLELDRLARDRVRLEEGLERDRALLGGVELRRAGQEESLNASRQELQGLQADAAKASEEHAALRANLASLEERQRSQQANRGKLEARIRELGSRRDNLLRENERMTAERVQLLSNNAELEAKGTGLATSIDAADAAVARMAQEELTHRADLAAAEEELKTLRSEVQIAQEKRSSSQVTLARLEAAVQHLEDTCQKELETTSATLAAGLEILPDESALTALDTQYLETRRKIEALGPVNPQALEEFEEAHTRQEFLSAQRQDLLDSIRDTEKAIHEIDGESRKRFGEAFHAINANFREMFKTLFGGGLGEMRLTDEDNLSESGIEIVASPPGKKLQNVLLLSGGEKSLTAMALLMGIFEYTPSPFCILDEIDAPLDEPNIERLTKLLKEMSERTQFIVITHAKRTMEAAQALYGVTMQEPGVSKLVSVKFKPHAGTEQNRAAAAPARELEREAVLV